MTACALVASGLFTPMCFAELPTAPSVTSTATGMDLRADQVVRAMSDFLAQQSAFSFDSLVRYDRVLEDGTLVEMSENHEVHVARPHRLRATLIGHEGIRVLFIDTSTLSVYDPIRKEYFQTPVRAGLDSALDQLVLEYNQSLPAADFIYADPYSSLMSHTQSGRYIGVERMEGKPAHHLVFTNESVEWQLWVDAGPHPVPLRIVINYLHLPGRPRFSATMTWRLSEVAYSPLAFMFEAPKDAERVDAFPIKAPSAVAAETK